MLNLLAAVAITGLGAATSAPMVPVSHIQPAVSGIVHEGSQLTEKQRRWFGRAVEHILRGER